VTIGIMAFGIMTLCIMAIGIWIFGIIMKCNIEFGWSAASFCHQEVACVTGRFGNFYLARKHKIAYNSTYSKAREK
jgi:hypothetical protein